jgi:hypothetical protein
VLLRGIFWFGLYLALALLPATVALAFDPFSAPRQAWLELGVALGLLAFPLVMIQFGLVSRLAASSRLVSLGVPRRAIDSERFNVV